MEEELPGNKLEQIGSREKEPINTGKWLSGVFEVSGGIGFTRRELGGKVYRYPYLVFGDNDKERVRLFQQNFGGNFRQTSTNWQWQLTGNKAALLLATIKDYSPSRKVVIAAVEDWSSAPSIEQKVLIANSITARERSSVQPEDYATLVTDSLFLAGLFDGRGNVSSSPRNNRLGQNTQLVVKSQNQVLLEALQKEYGGRVFQNMYRPGLVKDDVNSFTWGVYSKGGINTILDKIRPHIKFPNKIHLSIAA